MNRAVPEEFLAGGDPVPRGRTRRCLSAVESREQPEEEEKENEEEKEGQKKEGNGFHAVPLRRSGAFRAHSHTYDPFKRHSWEPGREFQDPLSRSRLQASECRGPQEAPLLQSQEELDTILGSQQQSGQSSHLGRDSCHPSAGSLDHSVTGMLSKSVSMSAINCHSERSDPDGHSSQYSATDLSKPWNQLEGNSGAWAGSSLRRTFSFLFLMTGKSKDVEQGR
ncbi:Hypothetical predicted protein [Marmota monax]|nr:hypothetical protein GHT09_019086 [Marmota monax]VTJ53066.1 Hypothetical predicted protein [Marmota monax]